MDAPHLQVRISVMATATTPNQVRALNSPPVVISLRAKRDRPNSHDRCRNSHFPPSFACLQDFDEIIAILKSKKNPRGIKVAVSALLWGEDYYASCDDSEKVVQGEIDRWQGPDKAVLMIRWTGYNRCQAAPLSTLRRAANGELLNFVLIPGPNGALPTRDIEPAAPPPPPRENPSPAALAAAPQPATDGCAAASRWARRFGCNFGALCGAATQLASPLQPPIRKHSLPACSATHARHEGANRRRRARAPSSTARPSSSAPQSRAFLAPSPTRKAPRCRLSWWSSWLP